MSEPKNMKYYLMIGTPSDSTWKAIIQTGEDMALPAKEGIEALGGKLISYYLGVGEAKNYGVVAFPSSMDIAKIVYMRVAQGVMKDLQFIEVVPSGNMVELFAEINPLITEMKMQQLD